MLDLQNATERLFDATGLERRIREEMVPALGARLGMKIEARRVRLSVTPSLEVILEDVSIRGLGRPTVGVTQVRRVRVTPDVRRLILSGGRDVAVTSLTVEEPVLRLAKAVDLGKLSRLVASGRGLDEGGRALLEERLTAWLAPLERDEWERLPSVVINEGLLLHGAGADAPTALSDMEGTLEAVDGGSRLVATLKGSAGELLSVGKARASELDATLTIWPKGGTNGAGGDEGVETELVSAWR